MLFVLKLSRSHDKTLKEATFLNMTRRVGASNDEAGGGGEGEIWFKDEATQNVSPYNLLERRYNESQEGVTLKGETKIAHT